MIPSFARIIGRQSRERCPYLFVRQSVLFSTSENLNDTFDNSHFHEQEFVRETLTDPDSSWDNRAQILSAEDFANRPRVNFSEEFHSLHDAGVVLSWIDSKQQDIIYQYYLDTMEHMHKTEKNGVTSHEYVMQLIAKKFQIKPMRAAAIVQLLHNEDQIRNKNPEIEIRHGVQDYVDQKIAEHIRNAYSEYDEVNPHKFVEHPKPFTVSSDANKMVNVPDDLDLSHELHLAEKAEQEEIQSKINSRFYLEDKDDQLVDVSIDSSTRHLMQTKKEFENVKQHPHLNGSLEDTQITASARPRWKYVAQILDSSHPSKKTNTKHTKKKFQEWNQKEQLKNTIVEQSGSLRPATIAEASETAWKMDRDDLEFMYKGVKQAWLEKTLRGEVDGWGRIEAKQVEATEDEIVEIVEEKIREEDQDGGKEESDNSSKK